MYARLYWKMKNDRLEVGVYDSYRQEGEKVHIQVTYFGRLVDSERCQFIKFGDEYCARAFFNIPYLLKKLPKDVYEVHISADVRGVQAESIVLPASIPVSA